jgi:signal transduction histidine kinase
VAEAVAAATREALRNVLKHAGSLDSVSLFVESGSAGVEVVVRDRGVGFDPASVPAGGGLAGTYAALRRHGGECAVASHPGDGVKVTIRWPAGPAGPTGG